MGVLARLAERPRLGAEYPADHDFWYTPVGGGSLAGERVTAERVLALWAVYACTLVRGETMGSLPLKVFRRLPDGGKEPAPYHPMYRLLHDGISEYETARNWREFQTNAVDLRGNGLTVIQEWGPDGYPRAMESIHPDQWRIETSRSGEPRYVIRDDEGHEETLGPGDVLHEKGRPRTRFLGQSLIEAQRETFGQDLALMRTKGRFWKNGTRVSGVIERPRDAGKLDANAFNRLRDTWREDFGGSENAGGTPILEDGMTFKPISVNPEDAQWLETEQFGVERTCGLFRVPPHKIAHLLRATFSNIEHQGIEFVTDCILPQASRREQVINWRFFRDDREFFCEHVLDGVLRGDSVSRSQYLTRMVLAGILTRNEARVIENHNRIEGLDEPLTPTNTTVGPEGIQPTQGGPNGASVRERALLVAAAERMVAMERREIERLAKRHAESRAGFLSAAEAWYGEHGERLREAVLLSPGAVTEYVGRRMTSLDGDGLRGMATWSSGELVELAMEDGE